MPSIEGREAEEEGGTGEDGKTRPVRPRPLPRAAKRLVALIDTKGADRVVVPDGFGTKLLEGERDVLAPTATVVPSLDARGRPIGLEVKGIRPNGVVAALGFLEGDIIQSVNGRPTRDPDHLIELVDVLDSAKVIRVRLKRDGKTKTLRIDVER